MSNQLKLSPLKVIFESALQDYESETGIALPQHPLAEQLQNCHSVESITALLQGQAQALGEFKGSDKIMKSLKNIVSVMFSLSASAALGDAVGLVRQKVAMGCSGFLMFPIQAIPPGQAINAGIAVLLAVCSFL
jgi:hypothetical protein